MEKDLDPEVIKTTQNTLGKFVKRPPLTEKLLKKPPFRFLHDIVTSVLKTTGFFEGLFEEDELVSDNVKDRESKIAFLNKVIAVVGATTGEALSVKSTKVVAGQEPDKTNELLQCLALALDKKLSSDDAVRKLKNGTKPTAEPKSKEVKPVKKNNEKQNETKKLTSRSSEKLTSNKKDTKEKSVNRNDKDKVNVGKVKQKDNVTSKKDSPPKKTVQQQSKPITKKGSIEKQPHMDREIESYKNQNNVETKGDISDKIENNGNNQDSGVSIDKQDDIGVETKPLTTLVSEQAYVSDSSGTLDKPTKLHSTSYTIAETDLNSSLSSQDLMEVDNENIEDIGLAKREHEMGSEVKNNYDPSKLLVFGDNPNKENPKANKDSERRLSRTGTSGPQSSTKDADKNQELVAQLSKSDSTESNTTATRPKSVRPSSTRPGAPRLREKHENVASANDNILLGKVNIIVENTPNDEEEDASIIIIDQPTETSTVTDSHEQLNLTSNQHGHLVQQILESQKEFSQIAGKTEIEWQFGAQKAREAVNQEIEQLRFNIQALSRVANPLGKLLDHIQEDVEVMRQELQQWTKTYEEASTELQKQKTANEDSLHPLHTKRKQLDVDIDEKRDKINDLKIVIHKNSLRIEKLLAGGDVQ